MAINSSPSTSQPPTRTLEPTNTDEPTNTSTHTHTPNPTETLAPTPAATPTIESAESNNRILARVVEVVDGNTIKVEIDDREQTVRYIGVSTPSMGGVFSSPEWLATEATEANRQLVENYLVYLEEDGSAPFALGEILRHVFLSDGTFVNEELIRLGYARVDPDTADTRYYDRLLTAQQQAEQAGHGIWGPTPTPTPTDTPEPTRTPWPISTPHPQNTPTTIPTYTPIPSNTPSVDSTNLPTPSHTPYVAITSTSPPTAQSCTITASVSDENPSQNQEVYVYGQLRCGGLGIEGAAMNVTWNYKTTTSTCTNTTDSGGTATCSRSIGYATSGYYVQLDVTITWGDQSYRTTTGFTPQ